MASTITGYACYTKVDNGNEISFGSRAYGVCTTAGNTAAKTVDMTGFVLTTGCTIFVKFNNANTATTAATLNVNSTGAKTIKNPNWTGGSIVAVTYDGTNWVIANIAAKVTLTGKITGTGTMDENGNISFATAVGNLTYSDIGAAPTSHRHPYTDIDNLTPANIGAASASHKHDYSTDILNPPAINNGKLTITLNGDASTAKEFTANQAGNTSVDITPSGIGAAAAVHTHSYAGAASSGAAATNAQYADTTLRATPENLVIRNIKISTSDSITGLSDGDILFVRES